MKIFFIVLITLIYAGNTKKGYNPALAKDMIVLSSITYQQPEKINNWSCVYCRVLILEDTKGFDVEDAKVRAVVGYYPTRNAVVVGFRGSSNIKNWVINLDFALTPYPDCGEGCLAHLGFHNAYSKSIAPVIRKQVKQLLDKHNGAKIMVTGHSLGAAMAIFSALDLKKTFGKAILYSFGAPRVSNKKMAEFIQREIPQNYRIVSYGDIVCQIPAQSFGYHHAGHEIFYQKGMTSYEQYESQDPRGLNSVPKIKHSLLDHAPIIYVKLQVPEQNSSDSDDQKQQTSQQNQEQQETSQEAESQETSDGQQSQTNEQSQENEQNQQTQYAQQLSDFSLDSDENISGLNIADSAESMQQLNQQIQKIEQQEEMYDKLLEQLNSQDHS